MRVPHRFRPLLEGLEERACPALTLKLVGADLLISGVPNASLTITGVAASKYQVKDGSAHLGFYSLSRNLQLSLHHYSLPITIDLQASSFAGNRIGGNVLLSTTTGNVSGVVQPVVLRDGFVGGSVTVTGGSGNETVQLGVAGGTETLRVGGSVSMVGRNGAGGNLNDLRVFDGSSVGGAVSATLVSSVQIGESVGAGARIGSLSVQDTGAGTPLSLSINQSSVVGGALSVTGTSVPSFVGDIVVIEGLAEIGGTTSINLGEEINLWQLGGQFHGNVTLQGGGGTEPGGIALNTIQLANGADVGTFDGSLSAFTRDGSTAFTFPTGSTIAGNLTLQFGNGTNDLGGGLFGGSFVGAVAGNLQITLGNGTNTALIETAPGGKLTWRSGNGTSSLTLGSAATLPSAWLVDLVFGTGTNSLTLASTGGNPQLISGSAMTNSTTNTFSQDADWTIGPVWISNF